MLSTAKSGVIISYLDDNISCQATKDMGLVLGVPFDVMKHERGDISQAQWVRTLERGYWCRTFPSLAALTEALVFAEQERKPL